MAFFLDEIDSCLWDYLRQTEKKIVLYGCLLYTSDAADE